ncbi:MMPL family transporter [Vibrio sp. Of7-15]|uniref:efflux RND transporter permease subunit n=1 Tax=Vibrio sp. Of7-15 TaxID=2724879 RepID=UPI001EF2C339|nr:MMPL family transporter [Vibrio sp. Of7-15]MCG7495364.1 MMPL family transporter [Vibrio sp. Of7-15]
MNKSLLNLPTQYPKTIILFVLFTLVAATLGAKNLYFRGDYNIFFDGSNKQLQAFDEIQATFNKTDNLSIVIAPKSGDIFTPKYLTLLQEITHDAWQTPYSSRVDSIANYQHTEAIDDDLIVEDLLLEDIPLDPARIQKVKQIALNEPTLKHSLISETGHVAVVNVTVQLPNIDMTKEVTDVVTFADQLVEKYQKVYPEVEFHQAGIVMMNSSFMKSAQRDSSTLVPTMLLVILVFLGIMLRSFLSVLATLAVIIGTITATMGLSGWAGMFLSTATVNVPTLVMTLAVADCVHIIASLRQAMQQGKTKDEAIVHSLQLNFMPILITSVTTAIGFLMMNASDSPVLRDLGNLSALGVMIAFVLAVTLLPAMLKVMPLRIAPKPATKQSSYMDTFANFIVNNRKVILPLSVITLVATASFIPSNSINDDAVKYFDTSNEFRQAADFMEQNISGMTSISIAIKAGESQAISKPEFIKTVGDFTQWLREQPETDHVASLSDTYLRLNKNMHGDDESYYKLPQDRELAAQYLLLYEMSLPYGLDLNNQLNIDKSSIKIQLTTKNFGSKELVDIEERIYQWFATHAPQYEILASSPSLMFAHIGETNMDSMLKSLPIALVLISVLLVFALRSLPLGVISLVPNLVPAAIGFGIWALISGEINLGLSIVVSLTLGIVVDDTVHFLSKYQHARKQGNDAHQAVRYAFNTVGRALWITTVVLIAGFSVLAMSDFRLNSDMGQLSALIIFIALVVDFFMLPTLLMMFDKKLIANNDTKQESNATTTPANQF